MTTADYMHERAQAYRHYLGATNVIVSGGAAKVVCPLCTTEHEICQFSAGSLLCLKPDCGNPHHGGR